MKKEWANIKEKEREIEELRIKREPTYPNRRRAQGIWIDSAREVWYPFAKDKRWVQLNSCILSLKQVQRCLQDKRIEGA
ncbi:MAG: hypothetical protein LBN26_05070 [Christensenellaceae bacterium]|nr:hypothetical protein [Christensenellaceae bacterium]